jgi:hypothetical protein
MSPGGGCKMGEDQGPKDLAATLKRIDGDWQEIKGLLRMVHQELEKQKQAPTTPDYPPANQTRPKVEKGNEESKINITVTSTEAQAIIQKVEKLNRETEFSERLEQVEKQNRKIIVLGATLLTIVALTMAVFGFLMYQANLFHKNLVFGKEPKATSKPAAVVHLAPAEIPKPAAEKPVAQKSAPADEEATAPARFVGSVTSNKYHYPNCKWAQTIKAEKLLGFKSVKEAQEEGYIPCPTCKPPMEDVAKD